jgi:hypothetical protein
VVAAHETRLLVVLCVVFRIVNRTCLYLFILNYNLNDHRFRYVKLEYIPFHAMEDYCREIRALACDEEDPADFIEATIFSREECVLTVGRFFHEPTSPREKVGNTAFLCSLSGLCGVAELLARVWCIFTLLQPLHFVTWHTALICHATTLHHATLHHGTVVACHVASCHVASCHVASCHVASRHGGSGPLGKANSFHLNMQILTTYCGVHGAARGWVELHVQAKINRLGLWYKPWWYKHCETLVTR